jgi:hypothetical protein
MKIIPYTKAINKYHALKSCISFQIKRKKNGARLKVLNHEKKGNQFFLELKILILLKNSVSNCFVVGFTSAPSLVFHPYPGGANTFEIKDIIQK